MHLEASLTGPFPRSEALVAATRDLDRGRVAASEVRSLFRSTEAEVARIEASAGLAAATGGYLEWDDAFRPVVESWVGLSVGPLTRWFETNTFYRRPVLHHPPERTPGALAPRLPAAARSAGIPSKAILPGPYTFAGLLENRSGETDQALIHRLGRLLAEEVVELRSLGYSGFLFQEPLLVAEPPSGPRAESVLAGYRALREGAGDAAVEVWTSLASAGPAWPLLRRLPVSAVGIDLAETEPSEVHGAPAAPVLGLGVLDPRTSLVEAPERIREMAERFAATLGTDRVLLGPGAPLDLLPWETAVRKVEALGRAVAPALAPEVAA